MNLSQLFGIFGKRKPLTFADDTNTQIDRTEIDQFLLKVLPDDEHEFIESYWISDDAGILDCSMADPEVLIENIREAYGVTLSRQDLTMSLHVLVAYVKALT